MSIAEYNAQVLYNLRHEHPAVKFARIQVGIVNKLQHKVHVATAELDKESRVLAHALRDMAESGAPDEPWAAHWRRVFDAE